jgi:hypothetical protein
LVPWIPRLLDSIERNRGGEGALLSWSTWPKDTGQEVHNRGDLEDKTIESNLVNRANRDRVQVKYYHN